MSFVTTGQMAEELGVDRERVCYLLRKARIRPIARAGMTRLYRPETLALVRHLQQIPRLDSDQVAVIKSHYPIVA